MTPDSVRVIEREARNIIAFIETVAEAASLETGDRKADYFDALRLAVAPRNPRLAPDGEIDARAAVWRCRVRIYDARDSFSEPVADSDDELEPGEPGTLEARGLRGVADTAVAMAATFHGCALQGLDTDELERKIRGLRPTLSRRGGNAVWRLHYNTAASFKAADPLYRGWMLRIDLQRVGEAKNNVPRSTSPSHPIPDGDGRRIPIPGSAVRAVRE